MNALVKDAATYERVPPEVLGNSRRVLISDLSGKSNILYKAAEMGIDLDLSSGQLRPVVEKLKELEHHGYQYGGAEGSFRLLLERALNGHCGFFELESFRVVSERTGQGRPRSVATVRVRVGGKSGEAIAQGVGPVLALDRALRKSLRKFFSCISDIRLTDYKVRVLDAKKGTAAKVRVLVQTSDGEETWSTVGVSENILEASYCADEPPRRGRFYWLVLPALRAGRTSPAHRRIPPDAERPGEQALVDAVNYKLLKDHGRTRDRATSEGGAEEASDLQRGWGV